MSEATKRLRTVPVQARAKRTVNHILLTAARLLDEVGVDHFNTNLLAERADVRVRTVYRYFPNKHAVVLCLAEKMYETADDSLRRTLSVLSVPDEPWWPAVENVIDDYFSTLGRTPGWVAIRRALQAVPGLDNIRREATRRHAKWLAKALRDRGLKLPPAKVRVIAAASFAAASAIIEPALKGGPRQRNTVIAELKIMIRSYLAQYLN